MSNNLICILQSFIPKKPFFTVFSEQDFFRPKFFGGQMDLLTFEQDFFWTFYLTDHESLEVIRCHKSSLEKYPYIQQDFFFGPKGPYNP